MAESSYFQKTLIVQCPIRMLQGTDDNSVEIQTATKLLDHIIVRICALHWLPPQTIRFRLLLA